jgi:hypothetical protein
VKATAGGNRVGGGASNAASTARHCFHKLLTFACLLSPRPFQRAGVSTIACGQALDHQAISTADLQPGVRLALSALTEREELGSAGYSRSSTTAAARRNSCG